MLLHQKVLRLFRLPLYQIDNQLILLRFIQDIQNLPPQQKIADACNNTIYPVQPPYVDYGTAFSTAVAKSESCDVNIFNSPP
jgi:hypothetical protein